jgi:regulator of sigma E protease
LNTVWAFLLTLGLLVVVHEWGHYAAARFFGVQVLRFSVGFGPVLWRRVSRSGVEWVLGALPLGGYVSMLDSRERPAGMPLTEAQARQAFDRQPLRARVGIVLAGPVANLLLAWVLYVSIAWGGVHELAPLLGTPPVNSPASKAGLSAADELTQTRVGSGEWRPVRGMGDVRAAAEAARAQGTDLHLRARSPVRGAEREFRLHTAEASPKDDALQAMGLAQTWAEPVLERVIEGGAAHRAGLQPKDRVLAVNDFPVHDAAALRQWIEKSVDPQGQPQSMHWRVQRSGPPEGTRVLEVEVLPDVQGEGEARSARVQAYLGSPPQTVWVRKGGLEGLLDGAHQWWRGVKLTVITLGQMLTGQGSWSQLSGPLSIADAAGQSVSLGWVGFAAFLAWISIGLGVMNLLPLPILDGGHLMYYLFEAVTGRPVSDAWLQRLHKVGLALLLLLMSLALFNDMTRFWGQP